jgi:glycosyltransferase involved in cell wall biosynthesis
MTSSPRRVSVFTPSHDTRFLDEAYQSLTAQSFSDWEWIVLLNGKASPWKPPEEDARVRVSRAPSKLRGVGALKRAACDLASGSVLVELDHDDRLARGCLAAVVDAFNNPAVVFAYSDWSQINGDGSPNHDRFDLTNGWVYSQGTIEGSSFDRCHAMAPTPHNLAYIWYAPNHVRAFRRSTYLEVGGYDPGLEFLDDQDLMVRLYQAGEFHHIERCLYFQRVHPNMTQVEKRINAAIQVDTVVNYRNHIEALILAWAKRRNLRCLRLRTPLWIGDEPDERYDDQTIDPAHPTIDAADNSVAVIKAYDVLHRVSNRSGLFNEAYRALVHAGLILTQTPSTDGRGAFQDPSAVAFYNENSFMYLTQQALHDVIPDLHARLQVSHLNTAYQTPAHEELDISYVQANLLAIKDGPRQGGPLLC